MRATTRINRGEPRHEVAVQPGRDVGLSPVVNVGAAVKTAGLHDRTIEVRFADVAAGKPVAGVPPAIELRRYGDATFARTANSSAGVGNSRT